MRITISTIVRPPGHNLLWNDRKRMVVKMYADWFEALKFEAERISRKAAARA